MTPRDVIEACSEFKITCDQAMRSTLVVADQIVRDLADAGYVILPAAEVEAIRDKALEEAAIRASECFDAIRTMKGAKP